MSSSAPPVAAAAASLSPPALIRARVVAALTNAFVGDSLAMPVHWFYNTGDILRYFPPNGVSQLEAAPSTHPSSIMSLHSTSAGGRTSAQRGGAPAREIVGDVILKGRRQYWGGRTEHYHRGLPAGANTLNAHCARQLMRFLTRRAQAVTHTSGVLPVDAYYDAQAYLEDYVEFMTADPPSHPDTYAESYHRGFFANRESGKDLLECGAVTHDTPSVGGLVGVAPLVLPLLAARALDRLDNKNSSSSISSGGGSGGEEGVSLEAVQDLAVAHVMLTHPDPDVLAGVTRDYVALLAGLLEAGLPGSPTESESGQSLVVSTAATSVGLSLNAAFLKKEDTLVVGRTFSPACYITDSWPSLLFFAAKYSEDPFAGLLANTNVGGDNVHRGSVLGALYGLMTAQTLPHFQSLVDGQVIESEVEALLDSVLRGISTSSAAV